MYATKSGIWKSASLLPLPPRSGLLVGLMLVVLLVAAGPAQAVTVSVTATENNGPVSVTANATFADGVSGNVEIYIDGSYVKACDGIGTVSCSIILDGATYSNGVHPVSAKAWDSSDTVIATDTFTIQNPVSLSAGTQAKPTEALDVTGNAQFLARTADGDKTGKITISTKLSTATGYTSWYEYFFTPNVNFSCEDVVGGLFDVAEWSNGVYDIKVDAMGPNDETIEPVYLTTEIMNPIDLTAEVDPKPTGPLNVTGTATFIARRVDGDKTGKITISTKLSTASLYNSWNEYFFTPNVNFSCEDVVGGLFDVAEWLNGVHDIKVDAMGANDETIEPVYLTTEIMNPIDLTVEVDPKPTGPLNVTGTATFIARRTDGDKTGKIIISAKLSTASLYNSWQESFFTPNVTFSCEDVVGVLFDVATWANGVYDIKVEASAVNSGSLFEVNTTTIDNTPKITASCPRYVSGDFDITGSAEFTEMLTFQFREGILYINIGNQSTSGAITKTYFKGDASGFSYNDMTGTTLNADALGHGEHVAYIIAQAYNGTWSEWLVLPFTTGEPEEDGSGNIKIVPSP